MKKYVVWICPRLWLGIIYSLQPLRIHLESHRSDDAQEEVPRTIKVALPIFIKTFLLSFFNNWQQADIINLNRIFHIRVRENTQ